jgi:aspartokinase
MITVEAGDMANIEGFMKGVAELFANSGISLDTIMTQGTSIDVTVILPRDADQRENIMSRITRLEPNLRKLNTGKCTYKTDRVLFREEARESISLIGSELRENGSLTIAEAIQVLDSAKIRVTSIQSPEDPFRVTLHVESGKSKKAAEILHSHFLENGNH